MLNSQAWLHKFFLVKYVAERLLMIQQCALGKLLKMFSQSFGFSCLL